MDSLSTREAIQIAEGCASSGTLKNGARLEYFVGGGVPPHRRADQFWFHVRDGAEVMELSSPWQVDYDERAETGTPLANEVWQLPASQADIRKMATLCVPILNGSDGGGSSVPDAMRREVVVGRDGAELTRAFPGNPRAALLDDIERFAEERIATLKKDGRHFLMDRGKKLPVPSATASTTKR